MPCVYYRGAMDEQVGKIRSCIKDVFLTTMATIRPTNIRITDYVKPMIELLDMYDPTLFTTDENRDIQNWVRDWYRFLYTESFIIRRFIDSNWHAHRLWLMSKIAMILKNPDIILILRLELKKYIQSAIIEYDTSKTDYGKLIDAQARDSIAYHVYTLFAILNTIVLLERSFVDITVGYARIDQVNRWQRDPSLRSMIQPAIQYLSPYLMNQKPHREFVDSTIPSDRDRPDYNKPFSIKSAGYLCSFMVRHEFWFT